MLPAAGCVVLSLVAVLSMLLLLLLLLLLKFNCPSVAGNISAQSSRRVFWGGTDGGGGRGVQQLGDCRV